MDCRWRWASGEAAGNVRAGRTARGATTARAWLGSGVRVRADDRAFGDRVRAGTAGTIKIQQRNAERAGNEKRISELEDYVDWRGDRGIVCAAERRGHDGQEGAGNVRDSSVRVRVRGRQRSRDGGKGTGLRRGSIGGAGGVRAREDEAVGDGAVAEAVVHDGVQRGGVVPVRVRDDAGAGAAGRVRDRWWHGDGGAGDDGAVPPITPNRRVNGGAAGSGGGKGNRNQFSGNREIEVGEDRMANKLLTVMQAIGKDAKIVFTEVTKYLPEAATLAKLLFPAQSASVAGMVNAVGLIQQAVA